MITKELFNLYFKELSQEEGLKFKQYRDSVGILTIAIGHNLKAEPIDSIIGRKLTPKTVLTLPEVDNIFAHDLEKVIDNLDDHLSWWSTLPLFAQYVLISLTFNMGINGLLAFHNTLACFQKQDWVGVEHGLENSKWYGQVGQRGPKLVNIIKNQKI